ncbi:MAG: Gfo/Idh/MocA family oxidoreductase [Pseudomonadota bacterium]
MSDAGPFRWAILGTGEVSRKFVLDLRHAGASAHVVASRRVENATHFAQSLGVPHVAEDYAEAVRLDVDAVYIATPPAVHETHALMAISAGKPVLIEKPIALNAGAARRIVNTAREAGVPCIEALWTRFQPFAGAVQDMLQSGHLGEIRAFDARFMAANVPAEGVSLFDPAAGGGSLLHRGVYPLSLARHFLGPVQEMDTLGQIGTTGVDEEAVLVLRHENGAMSTIRSSLRCTGREGATLSGTRGTLHLEGPIYRPLGAYVTRTTPAHAQGRASPRKLERFRESHTGLKLGQMLGRLRAARSRQTLPVAFAGNGYHYQAKAMMDCVRTGRVEAEAMPLDQSVEVMDLIDRARSAWGMPT